jgi:hypothetical protein
MSQKSLTFIPGDFTVDARYIKQTFLLRLLGGVFGGVLLCIYAIVGHSGSHPNHKGDPTLFIAALFCMFIPVILAWLDRFPTRIEIDREAAILTATYLTGFNKEKIARIDLRRAILTYRDTHRNPTRLKVRIVDNIFTNWITVDSVYGFSNQQVKDIYAAIKGFNTY